LQSNRAVVDAVMLALERSGTDRKTLYVQEQAARLLFYLSEPATMTTVMRKQTDSKSGVESLELSRAMRNLLDHASTSKNPHLQRWSASTLQNLIVEDRRRVVEAVNDAAAVVASGQDIPTSLSYNSCLPELVQSGGVMILCSLIGADDSDTRAHAVSSLSSLLDATRAMDASLQTLSEMTGGATGQPKAQDGAMIRAMVAGGGCSTPIASLILSADPTVARMGSSFVASLVTPLLADPLATASLSYQYDCRNDDSGLGACREAALEIATGPCLPAVLGLVREQGRSSTRPLELRQVGMEILAAVVLAVSAMGRSWANEAYEEGLEQARAPAKLKEAFMLLNDEGVMDVSLQVLQSGSGQSLGGSKETPSTRIREAAGMILGSLTSVSAEAIMNLQSKQVLSKLLVASNDANMTVASTMRGDGSPRCLGVLEAVANILMFAWQHPSGASSELLDRLIEVMDAGAIPYASKVLNAKLDWDSRDKSVGGMTGRTAACRLLACLFGIPLTDETGIGMRRLMDAVDSDARSYRGGEKAPSNIVEAVLTVLQTASNKAKSALLGTLDQGPHYQAALMDLVGASLLATGSMCGSSVAPGGSEGTMIKGDSFLAQRNDMYVSRRKEICSVACEVVVRAGRAGPPLLPAMLVGGFDELSVLASLRLALAIAQNGTTDQHAKLALSGILVPISDSLRSALSKGDLYKFSAALALVRFCGPHIAAGQGGGIESVRDAIRVATNVLTLPINPDSTIEQLETQESLKSECIAALESLSRNASLWSTISSDALPSIVRYLQNPSLAFTTAQGTDSRGAALRAVRQIVQVPSHAIAAAENGIVDALGEMLMSGEASIAMPALEVLHDIASNEQARRKAQFLEKGLLGSVCTSLGKAHSNANNRADVIVLGLEIIQLINDDVEKVLVSPKTSAFLDACCADVQFIRVLCASLLDSTGMKLKRHDDDSTGDDYYEIAPMYGPPLIFLQELCAGFTDSHVAAAALLFKLALYACAIESRRSETFWNTLLLQNQSPSMDKEDCVRVSATMCAHFLSLLTADYEAFVPKDSMRMREYTTIARPLVRYRLLQGLKEAMETINGENTYGNDADPYITSLIVSFNIPHVCLSLWKDPTLLDLAFELLKQIVEHDVDDVIHLFVHGKAALMSLFDLLNVDQSSIDTSKNVNEIRRFLATILGHLAEKGLLTQAVEKYEVRSTAIAALATACLSEEGRPVDDEEDTTSHKLSSTLMQCLVELCSVKSSKDNKVRIQLTSAEAEDLAKNVGKKICHMVLSRFLERARLKQYEIDDDEDLMDAPDIAMLCAIAQHESALKELQAIGGLHALGLIAAEGELSAMLALRNACKSDTAVLLEDDTFKCILNMIAHEEAAWRANMSVKYELECIAFDLMSRLASESLKGKQAVMRAERCEDCLRRAIDILSVLAPIEEESKDDAESADGGEVEGDEADEGEAEESDSDVEAAEKVKEEAVKQEKVKVDKSVSKKQQQPPRVKDEVDAPPIFAVTAEDEKLGRGACLFLSALISTDVGKKCFGESSQSLSSLAKIINESKDVELQHAALKLVVSSSRYASAEGDISVDWLSEVLTSVLISDQKIESSATVNANMMKSLAVSGIVGIFDVLQDDEQQAVIKAAKDAFIKIVRASSVMRSSSKETDRAASSEAAHNLLTVMLVGRGKPCLKVFYSQELFTACLQLIQWRHDPKSTMNPTDKAQWDGCVVMCLQLLFFALTMPLSVLEESGIDRVALAKTSLMLARPGKAPRKAIDVRSALERIIAAQDSSSVFAQSVLNNIFE
jgi:hypothetical protein